MTLPLGSRVTYADMPVLDRIEGTVAAATAEELRYAKDRRYGVQGVGPDAGDVLVQWDGDEEWDRSWEHPSGLRVLPCHCGAEPIGESSEHWPYRRGMCPDCATVRCDAYPGACADLPDVEAR